MIVNPNIYITPEAYLKLEEHSQVKIYCYTMCLI